MRPTLRPSVRTATALTALLALVIGWATLSPPASLPAAPGGDKLHHLVAFAALALPLSWARPRLIPWVVLGAASFGAGIELVQPFVNRFAEWGDALANTLGALTGALAGGLLARATPPNNH